MKICRVVTVPFFLQNHLHEQILATLRAGHEVTLVCGAGPEIDGLRQIPGIRIHQIDIPRAISLRRDFVALCRLWQYFRHEKFDLVHSATPKAGMLAALAGWLAGTPIRVHTFTGQPWMELKGLVRVLAKAGDWLTAHCTTMSYADSVSQRDFLVREKVAPPHRIRTIGAGSLAGVDLERFSMAAWWSTRVDARRKLGIAEDAKVITFIGRVTVDKGIQELVDAAERLSSAGRRFLLLLVGPFEPDQDPLPDATLDAIRRNPCIRAVGYSPEPERYLALTDIMCLPSYREGFGNVVIEAAAMGVPTVGSDIVGLRDSIVADGTGLLVPVKNVQALTDGLNRLFDDELLRKALGIAAQERAIRDFDARVVNARVLAEYDRLAACAEKGLRA